MRRVGPTLFIVPLLLAASASAETASQVFKQVSPSVVVVLTYNAAGKATELGSGVKLPDGSVATNCHVLKDGTTYRVRYRGKVYPASLDKADWNHDVCSLSVPGLPAPPVVLGSTKTLQVGASVYAIGTPEGLQRTLSEGIVSSLRPVDRYSLCPRHEERPTRGLENAPGPDCTSPAGSFRLVCGARTCGTHAVASCSGQALLSSLPPPAGSTGPRRMASRKGIRPPGIMRYDQLRAAGGGAGAETG